MDDRITITSSDFDTMDPRVVFPLAGWLKTSHPSVFIKERGGRIFIGDVSDSFLGQPKNTVMILYEAVPNKENPDRYDIGPIPDQGLYAASVVNYMVEMEPHTISVGAAQHWTTNKNISREELFAGVWLT